jgi:hypothetical protein
VAIQRDTGAYPDLTVVNVRKAKAVPDADSITFQNFKTMTDVDAALTAISGTTFSAKNLGWMTQNDKIYALRRSQDATSVGS